VSEVRRRITWSAGFVAMAFGVAISSPLWASESETAQTAKAGVTAVAEASKVSISEASSWPVVILTLLGMVALILLMAWFAKRFGSISGMGGRDIQVLSAMSVGSREKIALIDVKGTQLLIGVTANSINQLHTFDAPVVVANAASKSSFSDTLKQAFDGKPPSLESEDA